MKRIYTSYIAGVWYTSQSASTYMTLGPQCPKHPHTTAGGGIQQHLIRVRSGLSLATLHTIKNNQPHLFLHPFYQILLSQNHPTSKKKKKKPMSLALFLLATTTLFSPLSLSISISNPLLTPITKDHSTLQYTTTIYQNTRLKPSKFVIDLGFSFSWIDCQKTYKSSSYIPIPCNTTLCPTSSNPGCTTDTCSLFPENSFTRLVMRADAIIDTIALPVTNGFNPGPLIPLTQFVFSCARTVLLKGLAKGASGVMAFGRSNYSLPAQVSAILSLPDIFVMCLSGSPSAPGVAFFGTSGPYIFLPKTDVSKFLNYTPLILNPVATTNITYSHPSDEYFIGVTSIKINGKHVPINSNLLTIDHEGIGGTKIITVAPYTIMERSIYEAFTEAFTQAAKSMNITIAKSVKPFKACFLYSTIPSTRVGPAVPIVDLVLHEDDVIWRVFGANSIVSVDEDVLCLAFVDGGLKPRTSIVLGGYQMEDNLLQFDLSKKRIGFSSSLLLRETTCANFNFTSNA
ncbi:probable aspartic proteinase GIP2 [Magnolia sinica]|uniref:probable aspartic proteinase GIP2 n=1 Tax=Magnolia sinica TaxID=86752 RepID=UPI002658B99C|nr:probable aspartic proteinase GIP2 [Magnolia sinica]